MKITHKTKLKLARVKDLCDMIMGAYEMRDYDRMIALLHKVAYQHLKICESEVGDED